jgi:O-antigen polysaccharide polymerase Wzy
MLHLITWIAWLLCLLTGFLLLFFDKHNELQWISPLRWFGIAFFVLHVITSFNVLYFRNSLDLVFDPVEYFMMCIASILGGVCFWLGWRSNRRLIKGPATVPAKISGSNLQELIQMLLLIPFAILSLIVLIRAYGGLLAFAVIPIDAYDIIGKDYFNIFSLIFASFVPLIIITFRQYLTSSGSKRVGWAFAGILAFVLYFFISMKLGSRYRLIFVILPVFALYLSTRSANISSRSLLIFCCYGLIFYIIGRIRYQLVLIPGDFVSRIGEYFANSKESLYLDIFMSGDFDAFQNGMYLLHLVPYYKPLMWGSTLFSVLYNPIPRFIWPGKPSPAITQYLIEEGLGPASMGHYNFAVSLIAELYANFWWVGIILGMIIVGIVSAHLWNWFLRNRQKTEAWFHIGLFCAYLLVVTRGSFHSMTAYYLMIALTEIITRMVARVCAIMLQQNRQHYI